MSPWYPGFESCPREEAPPAARLAGATLVAVGRLAYLTRVELRGLVASLGGQLANTADGRTTHLLMGQAQWPLRSDGRLSPALLHARRRT